MKKIPLIRPYIPEEVKAGVHESRLTTRFERIGTNYKLSNILAAVGLVQIQHIDKLIERRLELAQNYRKLLHGQPTIRIPETTPHGKHSYQSFCMFIENRDEVMRQMREQGIEVQIGTYALHQHPAFAPSSYCQIHADLSGSQYAFEHCLTLPLYHELRFNDQKRIVDMLIKLG